MGAHFASQLSGNDGFSPLAVRPGAARPAGTPVQRVAAGTIVFAEGDVADSVFEVVSGTLRLHKVMVDGRRQVTGFVSGGRLLGVAQSGEYLCTAEAVTPVVLRRHPRAAFERRIDAEPGLARRILAEMCNDLRRAQDQMLLLGRKSAVEKVASFLLSLAADEDGDYADSIDLPMSRTDIADYLGLTTETVSRTFTKLRNDGLIALPCPVSVEFLDLDQLEDLATGGADGDGWARRPGIC